LIGAGLALLWLSCCLSCSAAPPFASRRLSYGTYELTCKLPLAQCLDGADQVCDGTSYDVLSAHDRRTPIDARGLNQEIRASDAVIHCLKGKPLFGAGPEAPAPVAGTAAGQPSRACVPGATQVCVGSGACSGGQSCLADGSGYGPCACGPVVHGADGGVD
jgi:hypothetical protein